MGRGGVAPTILVSITRFKWRYLAEHIFWETDIHFNLKILFKGNFCDFLQGKMTMKAIESTKKSWAFIPSTVVSERKSATLLVFSKTFAKLSLQEYLTTNSHSQEATWKNSRSVDCFLNAEMD